MPIRTSKVEYDVVELRGGLDQITPTLSLKPGVCRDSLNFECSPTGGYSRIGGYERYDGQAKPSAASYQVIQVTSFTNTPTVGQTLTGFSSAATGQIIALGSNYIVLTLIVGTFTSSEVVKVGATTIGTATTLTTTVSALLAAQYTNLAADVYRALILKVPGSGSVLGVAGLVVGSTDNLYAFRANAGATGVDLYKKSASGWVQVAYKYEISFTAGGATAPAEGTTLTQGGVTAVIRRVMDSSGTWAANSAAGRFVIDAPAGGNFAAGAATIGAINVTISAIQTAITMAVGGKFEFAKGNFTGSAGTVRLYGCDGVNRMFEFDGATFAPIPTGATSDAPKHIIVHRNHLIGAIRSSLMYSGPGVPFRYATADGGGEIATGDTITNLILQPGNQTVATLAVYCAGSTNILYGTGSSDWNFVPFNSDTGALDYTGRNLSQSYALGNLGVTSLATTQAYGNFEQATLTDNIKTFITDERSKVTYSTLCRDSSQYRLFFSDGYGLYVTIVNGKLLGCMPVLLSNTVNCAWEGQLANGSQVAFFGDTSGYVHQMDVGSSFDGASIDAFITINWNTMRSPRVLKTFRHASVEMTGNFYAAIQFGFQLGYGTTELTQPTAVSYASAFSPAPNWDSFTWDSFTWDGRTLAPTEVDMRGTAENIQVTISSTTDYIYPFTINSIISHYSPRRGMR